MLLAHEEFGSLKERLETWAREKDGRAEEKEERRKAKEAHYFIHISWPDSVWGPSTNLTQVGGCKGRGSFVRIHRAHLVLQRVCACFGRGAKLSVSVPMNREAE